MDVLISLTLFAFAMVVVMVVECPIVAGFFWRLYSTCKLFWRSAKHTYGHQQRMADHSITIEESDSGRYQVVE